MTKKENFLAAGTILLFFMGCAGLANLPDPESSEAKLYREKCTQCHRIAHPKRHRDYEWEHFFQVMKGHMENRGISLSAEEEKTILGYLKKNAR